MKKQSSFVISLLVGAVLFVHGAAFPQETGRDFIHEHSVFDITYPVFLDIDSVYRSCEVPEDSVQSLKMDFVHETSIYDVCYPVFRALYTFDDRFFPLLREPNTFKPDLPTIIMYGSLMYQNELPAEKGIGMNRYGAIYPMARIQNRSARYLRVFRRTMLRDTAYDETAEKARLVREMEAFRDTAAYLPSLYAVIDGKYGGDVERYVKHLYRRAVLTNRGAMFRFRLNPSKRRMRRDAGFQFVLSRMMYRLWEALGRPEEGVGYYVIRNERFSPQTDSREHTGADETVGNRNKEVKQ